MQQKNAGLVKESLTLVVATRYGRRGELIFFRIGGENKTTTETSPLLVYVKDFLKRVFCLPPWKSN